MARLIDADKLKNHYSWWEGGSREMTMDEAKKTFDTIVDVQPTVDAVPTELERQVLYNEIMDNCRRYIDDELYNDKTRQAAYRAMMLACGTVACMPTNDAVEVVRCKDCIHSGQCTKEIVMKMRDGSYLYCPMGNKGFCSHGERKEDANAHNTLPTR